MLTKLFTKKENPMGKYKGKPLRCHKESLELYILVATSQDMVTGDVVYMFREHYEALTNLTETYYSIKEEDINKTFLSLVSYV